MEVITEFDPAAGFTYTIVAQGGSERIQRRVLKAVLETERESTTDAEWRKANLSRANYEFDFGGDAGDGMLRMQLTPRRRTRASFLDPPWLLRRRAIWFASMDDSRSHPRFGCAGSMRPAATRQSPVR